METRLSRICDAIIEAGWLVALIVTPLYFNTNSSRVFEPDKLSLLRSIALLMSVAWIVQLLDVGWQRREGGLMGAGLRAAIRQTPLVLPTLLLAGAYLLSTLTSLVPSISFFGSYVRLQGTFSFLSYVVIFLMVLTHLRSRVQLTRLEHAIILTSVPISLYALIQHYGLDPLPWGGNVQDRVAANMGNAIFVAAYLIMAFFLALERLLDSMSAVLNEDHFADVLRVLAYVFILGIQIIAIVFTQSRGPWLGLAAGLYVFGMLGLRLLSRRAETGSGLLGRLRPFVRPAYFGVIGLTIVGLAFLVVLNIPNGPLQGLRKVRYLDRMGTVLSTTEGTNAVRVLIWEGVVDMMFQPHNPIQYPANTPAPWYATPEQNGASYDTLNPLRLLIGYGPESMWVAYNRFYPPDLAHYELRNASPDRSHNETFDAIVRTGILGFAAELAVFGSIFYFALRWLGLMRSQGRRNLFLALLAAGASVAILALWAIDNHSLRLAGIGLPVGLIFGLIIYVTLDLLLPEPNRETGAEVGPTPRISRHPLLVVALFSAIVAHYAEIHLGIAIASTLTHFWILSGVLVVVGMGWLREDAAATAVETAGTTPEINRSEPVVAAVTVPVRAGAAVVTTPVHAPGVATIPGRTGTTEAPAPRVVESGTRGAGKGGRAARAEAARSQHQKTSLAAKKSGSSERPGFAAKPAPERPASAIRLLLPYVLIGTIVSLVLAWDYIINQAQATGALNVLWQAFTTRALDPVNHANIVSSPWLLVLVLLTWLLGGGLALAETYRNVSADKPLSAPAFRWGAGAGIYFGAVVLTFFIYGLFQAGMTQYQGLQALDIFRRIAGAVPIFDFILLLFGLGLAWVAGAADRRPRPYSWLNRPALSVTAAIILSLFALLTILTYNVKIVEADIYYKQGQAYEDASQPEGAVVLYNQAALMEPKEDFYYLFLGRALLEFTSLVQPGTASMPADVSKVPTDQLLKLAQNGMATRTREDIVRAANAVLVAAQRINPLNTDHTANLARLYRSWAFINVPGIDSTSSAALRQTLKDHPDQADAAKLDRSLSYYQQALSLSPNNAGLWNEDAFVRLIKGDAQGAMTDLDRSLSLDKQFEQTYLYRGDALVALGDTKNAVEAYKQALARNPTDKVALNMVGYYSAQLGDTQTSVNAYQGIIDQEAPLLDTAQKQLSALDAQAAQAGGYDKLNANVNADHQAVQANVEVHREQVYLAYQNQALVLHDAGRKQEALDAAQAALAHASTSEKTAIQQLIAEWQKQ